MSPKKIKYESNNVTDDCAKALQSQRFSYSLYLHISSKRKYTTWALMQVPVQWDVFIYIESHLSLNRNGVTMVIMIVF